MAKSLVLISAIACTTMAQTTSVTSLFLPGFDSQSLVASVVTANPTMAEFFVQCAPGVDSSDCGAGPGVSVTMQPGTYAFGINEPPALTMSARCVIEQQTAVCTTSVLGSEANDPGVETQTLTDITTADFFMPVTVTAGLDKLAAATATGAVATAPTSTGAGTGASASASSDATSVSTGGAPYATRNAVMAGVAAIVGGAIVM